MEPIRIRGLKQNNLKNISLDIPKNKKVVFIGTSKEIIEKADTITAEYLRKS